MVDDLKMDRSVSDRSSLRTSRQDGRPTIGVLVSGLADSRMQDAWSGAADAAREQGANLICFAAGDLNAARGNVREVLCDLASAETIDGLVTFLWWHSRERFESVCARYRPLPVVNCMRLYEGYPGVAIDDYQSTRDVIAHLVEVHGCRRIAHIARREGHLTAENRYRGYVDALAEHGIPLNPDLVKPPEYPWEGGHGICFLMDDRGMQPGVDFEAVVTFNDLQAAQALDALESRGVRVPYDVAVVGFDDTVESRIAVPPLTTVSVPWYGIGRRAAEQVLARLAGEQISERVTVHTPLAIRQSCGCLDPMVAQATAGATAGVTGSFEAAFSAQRERILAEMAQVVAGSPVDGVDGWAARLLDAFVLDLGDSSGESEDAFLPTLDEVLRRVERKGGDLDAWQGVLSAMRRHMLPCLGHDAQLLRRADDLCQQGRVFVGRAVQRAQARRYVEADRRATTVREIGMEMLTVFDVGGLADVLAQELPGLGIPSCYLSLYEEPGPPEYPQAAPDWSKLILAYDENGRVELGSEGRRFRSRQLVADDLLPRDRLYSMVVELLYFQDQQLGFVLFEAGPRDGLLYETLARQISSALQGALLTQQQERARAEAEKVQQQLEAALEEVQAVQRRYLRQAWEDYVSSPEAVQGYYRVGDEQGPTEERWLPAMMEAVEQRTTVVESDVQDGSTLAIPLTLYGEVIGALGGRSSEAGGWSEDDIAAVEAIVEQMALALDNQRLFDDAQQARSLMEERVRALDSLNDIGRKMEEAPPIPELLQWVAERTPSAMRHADVCRAAIEFEGQVYGSTEAVNLPCQMVQGLRVGSELIGLVYIAYTEEHDFLDEESALLGDIARRVSGYIESRRLLAQIQERARREQFLREITVRVRGSTDPDAILRAAVRELGSALGRRAFVRMGDAELLSQGPVTRADRKANTVKGGE